MKRFFWRFTAVAIAMLCACSGALALSEQGEQWLFKDGEAAFSLSAGVEALVPWTDSTLEMLNRVLGHMTLEAAVNREETVLALAVDGEETVRLEETAASGGTELTVSALPNRALISSGSAVEQLLTVAPALVPEEDSACPYSFDLAGAVSGGMTAYPALKEKLAGMGESKAANYSIKNVGKGSWVILGRLTKEQSAEIHDELCAVLSAGFDDAQRDNIYGLTFLKALTVAVYSTGEDGEDLAVYIKGNVKHPNGKTFELSYQLAWGGSGKAVTTYKLELGKGKRDGIAASGSVTVSGGDTAYGESVKSTVSFKSGDGVQSWDITGKEEYSGKRSREMRTLSGTVTNTVKTTVNKASTETETVLQVDLSCENGILTGTAGYSEKLEDGLLLSISMTLSAPGEKAVTASRTDSEDAVAIVIYGDEETAPASQTTFSENENGFLVGTPPAGMTAYNAPQSMARVDLDSLTEEALAILQGELFQNTAGATLQALFTSLPVSDLSLFSDSIDEEAFSQWLSNYHEVND